LRVNGAVLIFTGILQPMEQPNGPMHYQPKISKTNLILLQHLLLNAGTSVQGHLTLVTRFQVYKFLQISMDGNGPSPLVSSLFASSGQCN
jgi:hypothetical protein